VIDAALRVTAIAGIARVVQDDLADTCQPSR
jgi:hypothetical protein